MPYSDKMRNEQKSAEFKFDKTYFEKYVKNERTRIDRFSSLLSECKTDVQAQKCNLILLNLYKNIIYCKCSLKKYFSVQFNDEFYANVKNFLLLSKKLSDVLPKSEIIDSMAIDYLFSSRTDDAFKAFYDKLKELSELDGYREIYSLPSSELAAFMENSWYSKCAAGDFPWYDSHLSKFETFVGYFSFVASAIAKKNALPVNTINFLIE
ncbi:MAG: DUF1911 domain-containing protein [Clostridia bacterium]|nr:DUF1911 domain-containing protein [Clostridia bacterium]